MTIQSETPPPVGPPMDPSYGTPSLRLDHELFDRLAEHVLATLIRGDRAEAAAAITGLQWKVLAHLAEEEQSVLPAFARDSPEEARILMEDHAKIRSSLADLDVGVDLHLLRVDAVRLFMATLRAHATREDQGLYRWIATRQ